MSTRSAIIEKVGNDYYGIYCHNDGYINGVGKMLQTYYTNPAMVHDLIELGDLSSVGSDLIDTCAYHRDRDDAYSKAFRSKSITALSKKIGHNGYVYLYENEIWMVWITEDGLELPAGFYPLSEVIGRDEDKDTPKTYNCIHCGNPIYPTWYTDPNGQRQNWKHEAVGGQGPQWTCLGDILEYATAPTDAIWTEPKSKKNGAK